MYKVILLYLSIILITLGAAAQNKLSCEIVNSTFAGQIMHFQFQEMTVLL
jgi:hypothetical protein